MSQINDDQRAACRDLEAVARRLNEVYPDSDNYQGVLVNTLVITARKSFDEDGDGITRLDYFTGSTTVSHYELLGMLDFVRMMLQHEVTCHGAGD